MTLHIGITGANGFVGSAVAKRLILLGYDVIFLKRNKVDVSCLWHWNENIDVIIHCAAYLPPSYNNSSETYKCLMDNSLATLQLIEEAEKKQVKTFVHLSSGQIYRFSSIPADENSPTFPSVRAPYYLVSKLMADVLVDHFRQSSNMRIVTLRPSCIYGSGMKQGFLPRLTAKMMNNKAILPEEVGNYFLDLVYVDDVAWMVTEAAINPNLNGIYNVGGGEVKTTIAIAQLLAKLMNKDYNFVELCKNITMQPSHAPLNIQKAYSIGYRHLIMTDGLKSYVESL